MSDTLTQDRFAMPEPFPGTHQFGAELLEIGSTKVLEFAPLEQIPHALLSPRYTTCWRDILTI